MLCQKKKTHHRKVCGVTPPSAPVLMWKQLVALTKGTSTTQLVLFPQLSQLLPRARLEPPRGVCSEAPAHLEVSDRALGPAASSKLAHKRARNF